MKRSNAKNLVGCCGLYCGLCNKYQSKAPSRCVGCQVGEQHSWCSIWNCCVKKHGFEICTDCSEISDCSIFLRRKVLEWIPVADNLRQIKEAGLETWLREQEERRKLLEGLLRNYNEGRSMNLYCRVCARMPIDLVNKAMEQTKRKIADEKIDRADIKTKAKLFKSVVSDLASEIGINLD